MTKEKKFVIAPSFTLVKGIHLPMTIEYRVFTEDGEDESIAKKIEIIEDERNLYKSTIKKNVITIPAEAPDGLYYYTARYKGVETDNMVTIYVDQKYVPWKGKRK